MTGFIIFILAWIMLGLLGFYHLFKNKNLNWYLVAFLAFIPFLPIMYGFLVLDAL